MPKRAQYSLNWLPEEAAYLLTDAETGATFRLDETSAEWQAWLQEHRSCSFRGRSGVLNLLKEARGRGQEGYWYAYQRQAGTMVKRYLGRSEQIKITLLEEIAEQFAQSIPPEQMATQARSQQSWRGQAVPGNTAGLTLEAESREVSAVFSTPLQFEPLLMPKLQLPRVQSSLLPRPHLWELLDKGLEYKLTRISTPAGYGKTTLVSQWIAARSGSAGFPSVAYVTLDEGDNDPIRFWRYLIAACQTLQENLGQEALELLLAHRLPPFKPLERMLVALLNELSRLQSPCLLVLDDLHVLTSPQVVASLSFFVEHLPSSCHLLLLVRGDPPFSLVRLHAHNEILDISPMNLGFTLEEIRAFFAQELSFPLSQKMLRQIEERLDAWPAGLRLLARELDAFTSEEEIEPMIATFGGSHWGVREYFLSEVVHTLSAEQQTFLWQTCLLPRLNAALCQAVTGREDSEQLLTILRSSDRFLIPLDRKVEWTRYQTLFARAMQEEAERHLGRPELLRLAALASSWYEEHALLSEAIEMALAAQNFPRAAGLIEQLVLFRERNNAATLPELYSMQLWLERLPAEELESRPELCLHYAMLLLFILMESPPDRDGYVRLQRLLQLAEEHWRDANNTVRLASVFAFRALLANHEGKLLQAITWARQALAWLPPEVGVWRSLSLNVVGAGEVLEGNLDQARIYFQESLSMSQQQGNTIYARATRGMLSGVSLEYGELHHAAEQMRQILVEARAQEDDDDIAHMQICLAQLAYEWNRLDEAEKAAREVLAIGERQQQVEFLEAATRRLALLEHARGASEQAHQRLTSWLAHHATPATPQAFQLVRQMQATLARIQLATGQLTAVASWFASHVESATTLPRLQQWREQLLYARLLLLQGQATSALEQLEQLHAAAIQSRHLAFAREVQVLLVQVYARQGRQEQARAQLTDLLYASLNEGYLRLFLDEGAEFFHILRVQLPALRGKNLQDHARVLLEASGQETMLSVPTLRSEPLSSQEQKVLRLLAAGNSNAEIARELIVSVNTVRTQIQSIYRKLNVNNRVAASSLASQLELL